jgi:lipopolysaccharide transport system permease protein
MELVNESAVVAEVPTPLATGARESSVPVTVIEPPTAWELVDWAELLQYRDLYIFLVRRSVKVRYAQSAIGIGWAVIQPVLSMVLFTVIFGKVVKVSSEGVPYAVFSLVALGAVDVLRQRGH